MEKKATYWIDTLGLQPHPEGGYFAETYRAKSQVNLQRGTETVVRSAGTMIYFLITSEHFSAFHKILADETWHFYTGNSVRIHEISPSGNYICYNLGNNPEKNEQFQAIIPAGHWFAAEVMQPNSYGLVGCTVAPGFDFADFTLASRAVLCADFPAHAPLISRLTR